ncbi:PREDICTED: hydroxysteroid dehydrogenase-like protein 1 [Nicrophorus vespilloides]|uniref:Hydroxysteroid dehydrogenase-like protein 1 n=1 Tax=Nicrophorus vespilloides TaxID=110193 RepID=A0ABM1N1T2_NICVS|nr:PREDICTED: hydroxysteroid dehydrogenase-like protein 1 [Nicrophorus vespilloides]
MDCNTYTWCLAALGAFAVLFFLFETIWNLLQMTRSILAPYLLANEEESSVKKFGLWALVTGCTDGIGKEYAKELAKRGHSIVLVSRTLEKLNATAKEIESEFGVKTKIIVADFSKGQEAIDIVKKEIGKIPVSILVNNVGSQYAYPMYVGEVPEDQLWSIINVNVGAVTLLTRTFVEEMRIRGQGAIVNISSASELQPLPLMTAYAASKAYIRSFSEALRYEYSKYNVTVQHVTPFFVSTKMNSFSNRLLSGNFFVPDAASYAKHAAAALGKVDHTAGYWTHSLQYFIVKTFSPEVSSTNPSETNISKCRRSKHL